MSFGNHESFPSYSSPQEERISPETDIKGIRLEDVEAISDPEKLRNLLLAALKKAETLQSRLDDLENNTSSSKENHILQALLNN